MDLKDDEKYLKFQENQSSNCRCLETNTGHLFVKNVNPFNSIGRYNSNAIENHKNIRGNEDFIEIFDNSSTKQLNNTAASTAFVNEIMKNYPFHRNMFMNEPYDEIQEALVTGKERPDRPLLPSKIGLSTNLLDAQCISSCSRDVPKTSHYDNNQIRFEEYNEDNNRHRAFSSNETLANPVENKNGRAEKTTYCRPLLNMYNQEFVYKTMQRNLRLQKLVKKLVIAREREKQREAWNNYINDLKNKHRYYSNEPSRISPQYVPGEQNTPESVDDFYNTHLSWSQTFPCQHLLHDIYGAHNNMSVNASKRFPRDYDIGPQSDFRPYLHENNRVCYPTSSQANLLRLQKECQGCHNSYECSHKLPTRDFRGNIMFVEKDYNGVFDKIQGRRHYRCTPTSGTCEYRKKMCSVIRSSSVPIQTEYSLPLVDEEDGKDEGSRKEQETFKEKFKRVTSNIATLKCKLRRCDEDKNMKSLAQIEEKIDNLIKSINLIMVDIKSKKDLYHNCKCASVSCRFVTTSHNDLNRPKSDPYGLMKNKEYLCGLVQNSSKSLTISEADRGKLIRHGESSISKMDKIMLEEIKKSNKVKKDIEELLNLRNDRHCSVQITFDIPTKERSTEVTDSLSKAKLDPGNMSNVVVEEISSEGAAVERRAPMTIAVNTDPLGLLALLRISTETIKQFLSYMPNLNYNSYLSMLQLPSRRCVSHYICNICGAAFGRPSQLSDHIEQHNLGRTRDCCVCRHTLDMQRSHIGLFACRYCGQRFTRAYCCELHQQSCARRLGTSHDVNSSHILLR